MVLLLRIGKFEPESRPPSGGAFDVDHFSMRMKNLLYDGESKSRPAALPGAIGIDPIEALGQAGDVLFLDAGAEILDGDAQLAAGRGRLDGAPA